MLKGSVLWAAMLTLLSLVASNSQFELRPTNSLQYILKSLGGFADPYLKPVEIYTEVIEDSSADKGLTRHLQLSLTTSAKIISELILTKPTTEQLRLGENNKCTDIESSQAFKSDKLIADIAIIAVRNKNKGAITSQRCEIGNNKSLLSGVLRINEKEFEALDEFSQVKELCFAIARILFEDREKEKIMIQEEIDKYLGKTGNWKVSILRACTIGDSNCLECDGSNKNCVACGDGYVINGGVCVACTAPCATCKNTANYCLTCNDVDHTSVSNGVCICTDPNASFNTQNTACQCNSGYFGSPNNCIECDTNCATCIGTAGNCLVCSDTTYMSAAPICACPNNGILQGNTCISSPGYFFSSNTVSTPCNPNCATCSVSAGNCLTCSDTTHMSAAPDCACPANGVIQGTTCVCNSGYFFSSNTVCSACNTNCATCSWAAGNCLTCSDSTHMSAAPTCACPATAVQQGANCVCNTGYYFSSNNVCTACDANCATCDMYSYYCLTCADATHMSAAPACNCPNNGVQQGNTCVCNAGWFYSSNTVCSWCNNQCATCSGTAGNCLTCLDTIHMSAAPTCACPTNSDLQGNTCVCNYGYFFSSFTVCSACSANCYSCSGTAGNCLTCADTTHMSAAPTCACPTNSALQWNNCVCNDGYFFSSNTVCTACNANCATCGTDAGNCYTCSDYIHMSNPPDCKCPTNSVLQGKNCVCNAGYFFNWNDVCTPCNTNCVTCSGSAGGCLTCVDTTHMSAAPTCACPNNSILTAGTCVCIDGYFYTSGTATTCTACQNNCATCSNTAPNCLTCSDTTHMSAAPTCACPANSGINDSGQCVCNAGYYFSVNGQCSPCAVQCSSCPISVNVCSACIDPVHMGDPPICWCPAYSTLHQGACTCSKGFYFSSNKVCSACAPQCASCSTTDVNCGSCIDTLHMSAAPACACPTNGSLVGNTCVCNIGYYFSSNTVCSACQSNCASCYLSLNNCSACKDTTHMSVAPSCSCPPNSTLVGNTCVCDPGYYYSSNIVCSACNAKCQTCSSYDFCTACNDPVNTNFNPATGTCRCWDPYASFNQSSGTCQCIQGYYLASSGVCQICTTPCSQCSSAASFCIECDDSTNMNLNIATGTCTCKDQNSQFNPWVKACQNSPGCNCTSCGTINYYNVTNTTNIYNYIA